ncbi:NHLP leader peptide family natural product precursor [Bacillus sp. Marseille-P3661]|uniref:NHLP leader peptide family natural product precursor n=1 Tax=Bacillus sp. Marseille-P3661 TaxID=1936234 RepID=UPI000C818A98|nr:NHLP leader peptide family natural product precursor [Bacillus sp. Marseille-P3661]
MTWTVEKANLVFADLKERASKDETFRKLALQDPAAAVKELTGLDLPEGIEVELGVDENGIIKQAQVNMSDTGERELDETELDAVSGGTSFSAFILYGPEYRTPK